MAAGRAFIFIVILVIVCQVVAQSNQMTAGPSQIPLTLTVTDVFGQPIAGLTKDEIQISDGNQLKTIRSFERDTEPVSIGIVVDKSESANNLGYKKIAESLGSFVDRANEASEYFLMTFNESSVVLQDWSSDVSSLKKEFSSLTSITPKKNTKFFDAISFALSKFEAAKYRRKVLLVISDGADNRSKISLLELKKDLKRSDVCVYIVSPLISGQNRWDVLFFGDNIDTLVNITGGRSFFPYPNDVNEVFFSIAEELDHQYLIKIDQNVADGKWHDLKIKVRVRPEMKKLGDLKVRGRTGYFAN